MIKLRNEIIRKIRKKTCGDVSFLIKLQVEAKYQHLIIDTLYFIVVLLLYFYCSIAVQNPSLLHNLRSVHLLITGKFGNFHSANVISNSESCGDNLRKKPENQARQGPLLKDVEVDGFSNSI